MPPVSDCKVRPEQLLALRNLFGAVASATHMLADSHQAATHGKVLDGLAQAARRGEQIVSGLLDALGPGPPASHDLENTARACELHFQIGHLQPLLANIVDGGVRLHIDLAPRLAFVRCVPEELDEVLLELITNARRATREGMITLRTRRIGRCIWLTVADTGFGMTARQVTHALDADSGGHPGGGKGLLIATFFAARAGGWLRVRSQRGKGTAVSISLPLLLPPETHHDAD